MNKANNLTIKKRFEDIIKMVKFLLNKNFMTDFDYEKIKKELAIFYDITADDPADDKTLLMYKNQVEKIAKLFYSVHPKIEINNASMINDNANTSGDSFNADNSIILNQELKNKLSDIINNFDQNRP